MSAPYGRRRARSASTRGSVLWPAQYTLHAAVLQITKIIYSTLLRKFESLRLRALVSLKHVPLGNFIMKL